MEKHSSGRSSFWFGVFKLPLLAALLLGGMVSAKAGQVPFVNVGSVWKYQYSASPIADGWIAATFGDDEWNSGQAPLGYGDPWIVTTLEGGSVAPRPVTAYFRHVFVVEDSSAYTTLLLRLLRDDGAVVYLNGVEIVRSNMPDGVIIQNTLATTTVGSEDENRFFEFALPSTQLRTGENIVAVELHQVNVASSDMGFDLDLQGATELPGRPVVSIVATQPETSEPIPNALVAPGVFTLRRSGGTDQALYVWVGFGGTATNEKDYAILGNVVEIPAGESEVSLQVLAHSDDLVEGNETVVAELQLPATANPLPDPYVIDSTKRRAVVTIHDEDSALASVRITQPVEGESFVAGSEILIKAVATDPQGYVPRVQFYDGDILIGTSEIVFVVAPPNGSPITHEFLWKNASVGTHNLRARGISSTGAVIESDVVHIIVSGNTPVLPTVNIVATRTETSEPLPNALVAPGEFTIRRTGDTVEPLEVWMRFNGTAIRGTDYNLLSTSVLIPEGSSEASFSVIPKSDELVEGNETVVAELLSPPSLRPYLIDTNNRSAVVTIHDEDVGGRSVGILEPDSGDFFPLGAEILIRAVATDPQGYVPKVEFFAGDNLIGVSQIEFVVAPTNGTPITHEFVWRNAPAGTHNLRARGTSSTGALINSPVVQITVDEVSTVPLVSIFATRPETSEPTEISKIAPGEFTLRRTGNTNDSLSVWVAFGGSASNGIDYSYLSNLVTFLPGQSETTLNVVALEDNAIEDNETVIAELALAPGAPPRYGIRWEHRVATVVIYDEGSNLPVVSIEATRPETAEPSPLARVASGLFTLRRTGPTNGPLTVWVNYGGTATKGLDYGILSNVVTFSTGQVEKKIEVVALADNLVETDETVVAELGFAPFANPLLSGYEIDLERNRAVVTIHDSTAASEQVVLTVDVADGNAAEAVRGAIDSAVFLITRVGGPTNIPVMVQYEMSGTASNAVDYVKLDGQALMESNQMRLEIRVNPILDKIFEDEESVILTLISPVCPAIHPPPPECYLVSPTNSGRAMIREFSDRPPVARIVKPANGAVFTIGQTIEIVAEASDLDLDGLVQKIEILQNTIPIGVTESNRIVLQWTGATVGQHVLVARATDNQGEVGESPTVTILVREQNASAFVFRHLPDAYTPGSSLIVELRAEPPDGARAYGVEDRPPEGWVVSQISHEGVFDPATGKVKFGPFIDSLDRTLSYKITPPASATGTREFAGNGSVDGASYPIGGDRIIVQGSTKHPADKDGNWSIVLNELTAYAASWKSGESWNSGPVPIPLSFVTRAGLIWRRGEVYQFNTALGAPPMCWVPVNGPASNLVATASVEECVRLGGEGLAPGISANLQIHAVPPVGVSAYAVEESVPSGWVISNVSHEGKVDAAAGKIRWGIFLDNTARSLSYTVTPPANIAEIGRLRGVVSFDGSVREVVGRERVVSVTEDSRPRLEKCEATSTGIRLQLGGAAGQVGVLQRSSDLVNWEDVTTLFLPDGTVEFVDETPTAQGQNYYRLQVR